MTLRPNNDEAAFGTPVFGILRNHLAAINTGKCRGKFTNISKGVGHATVFHSQAL
jgi:hypothetical protein